MPYLDYNRDYSSTIPQTTISNGISPLALTCGLQTTTSSDLRYSAIYGNPYLRTNHSNVLLTSSSSSQPLTPPQPPPYTTLRNGSVPHCVAKSPTNAITSQYIVATSELPQITGKSTHATHV